MLPEQTARPALNRSKQLSSIKSNQLSSTNSDKHLFKVDIINTTYNEEN